MPKQKALQDLVGRIRTNRGAEQMHALKTEISRKHGLKRVFKNSEILEALGEKGAAKKRQLLQTRKVRSLSGVSVIAIMAKPAMCPHGTCIYCPGGPSANSPKSYTGFEPAARRAGQNNFDARLQAENRLRQLEAIGHHPQKCEVIVMGGTLNAQPKRYQDQFVKGMYEAFDGRRFSSWQKARDANQTAPYRVIGLTFETRPDYSTPKQLDALLGYGCTRIELGIQSLDEKVLRKANRGHTLRQSWEATQYCKDAFLKVGYHVMPGLFSTPSKDKAMFRQLFSDQKWRPDMLKIYPCLVMPGTGLYNLWKRGEFTPYNAEEAAEVIAECKRFVPPYCRIMRIDRDIPTNLIAAGVEKSNLREMVKGRLEEKGLKCNCIRCRETGLRKRDGKETDWKSVALRRLDYSASKGKEVFLSFEDKNDSLLGFLRLRLPYEPWRPEITSDTAGVRELHVFGEQMAIHQRKKDAVQHKRFGKMLLEEAGRIASEEWGCKKLLVISGVGVREYYQKQGFRLDGIYMGRKI